MDEDQHELHDVVHRGRDRTWLEQAQQNRRRRRRRSLAAAAAAAAVILLLGFLVNDGPRRSGMLDALGLTCGEFVAEAGAAEDQIFEPWRTHADTLDAAAYQHSGEGRQFNAETFSDEVTAAAAQLDSEPAYAVFTGWVPAQRQLSAAAVGGELLVGHHEEMWTITEAVSVVDPGTGVSTWRAELEDPMREEWQNPQRALYGVGALDGRVVLQTPAVSGDTDLVTFDAQNDWSRDCVRLYGDVDPVEVLQENPRAWPVVMNLNLGRLSGTSLLALHGLDLERGAEAHRASEVDIASGRAEPAGESHQVYPPDSAPAAEEAATRWEDGDASHVIIEEVTPLGQDHYLLIWEAGAIILDRR